VAVSDLEDDHNKVKDSLDPKEDSVDKDSSDHKDHSEVCSDKEVLSEASDHHSSHKDQHTQKKNFQRRMVQSQSFHTQAKKFQKKMVQSQFFHSQAKKFQKKMVQSQFFHSQKKRHQLSKPQRETQPLQLLLLAKGLPDSLSQHFHHSQTHQTSFLNWSQSTMAKLPQMFNNKFNNFCLKWSQLVVVSHCQLFNKL
jgi:hypothetical protein